MYLFIPLRSFLIVSILDFINLFLCENTMSQNGPHSTDAYDYDLYGLSTLVSNFMFGIRMAIFSAVL